MESTQNWDLSGTCATRIFRSVSCDIGMNGLNNHLLKNCVFKVNHVYEQYKYQIIMVFFCYSINVNNAIQIYSGITSGRVLDGEFLYTKIQKSTSRIFVYKCKYAYIATVKQTRHIAYVRQWN